MDEADIRRFAHALPSPVLVLRPDADFTIVGASAEYLRLTHADADIIGRPLFEVLPDNPALEGADGVRRS
jgi:hypothetical protein